MERAGRRTPNIVFVDFESCGLINPYKLQPARSVETGSFRVLPPLSPDPPTAPTPVPAVYRMTPPRTARRDKAAFVIIPEPLQRPPVSDSPLGRVSPFRGRGFKEPQHPRLKRDSTSSNDTSRSRSKSKSRLPVASNGHVPGNKSASSSPTKQGKSSIPKLIKDGEQSSPEKSPDESANPDANENNQTSQDNLMAPRRKLTHRNSVEHIILLNRLSKRERRDGTTSEANIRTPSAKRKSKSPNTLTTPNRRLLQHRKSVEKIIALNRAASPFGKKLTAKEGEAAIRTPSAKRKAKSPNTLTAPTRKPFEKRSSIEKLIALNRMSRRGKALTPAEADKSGDTSPAAKRKGSSTSRASIASITRASAASNRVSAANRTSATSRTSATNRTSAARTSAARTSAMGAVGAMMGASAKKRDSATSRASATSKSGRTSAANRTSATNRTSAKSNRSPTSSVRKSLASSIALSHMKSLHSSGEDADGKGKLSPAGSARSKKGTTTGSGRGSVKGGKRGVSPKIANISKAQMLLKESSKESQKSLEKEEEEKKKAEEKAVDEKTAKAEEDKKVMEEKAKERMEEVKKTEGAKQEAGGGDEKKAEKKKEKKYPEPSATLVRTTAAPAIELVKPDIIPEIIASVLPPPETITVAPAKSSESIKSNTSMEKVRALSRFKNSLKKKQLENTSVKGKVQGDADVEVLSANNLLNSDKNSIDGKSGISTTTSQGQGSPQVTPLTNAAQAKKKPDDSKQTCCKCCNAPKCCAKLGLTRLLCCVKPSAPTAAAHESCWRRIFCCGKAKDTKNMKKKSKDGCCKGALKAIFCCGCCCKKKKKSSQSESKCCMKCKSFSGW
ncbi:serine/arginine repetitive matrix protein 2-like [Nilaparvata lugens]|uniref:serine/arginine repetitive matrix protein 2-like n=1 Tax=Nilaparvata lugens TaxID=108931 RepID=UPI00193D6D1A|nr:serine/arginine repetitive matrix protein 2-like [Nilaparvata lugens]